MDLILTTFGTYLHCSGEMFLVKVGEETQQISARKVRSILITTGTSLSTDAIQLAIEKNIDIVFLDKFGDPQGRVWHGRPGSTITIRRQQLRLADTPEGFQLAQSWIVQKLDNQIAYLMTAQQKRTRLPETVAEKINLLVESRDKLVALIGTLDQLQDSIRGLEGYAGKVYWQTINLLLPEKHRFTERSRNPAQDEFNCLLNYGYGVLYGIVDRACVIAGLDPYVGFIHTDHYNKKSFVFDFIEPYRIWIDETVIGLFTARSVKKGMFDPLHNGFLLNKEGKAVLMGRLEEFLSEPMRHHNRQVQRREMVQLDCHRVAQQLLESAK